MWASGHTVITTVLEVKARLPHSHFPAFPPTVPWHSYGVPWRKKTGDVSWQVCFMPASLLDTGDRVWGSKLQWEVHCSFCLSFLISKTKIKGLPITKLWNSITESWHWIKILLAHYNCTTNVVFCVCHSGHSEQCNSVHFYSKSLLSH